MDCLSFILCVVAIRVIIKYKFLSKFYFRMSFVFILNRKMFKLEFKVIDLILKCSIMVR